MIGRASPDTAQPALSVVIPFYNEAESLRALLQELRAVLAGLGEPFEVLAIDDGSTDGTARELASISATWPALRVVTLSRNSGQAAALRAGFERAGGRWIAMLDGDGQNPPGELPRLWALRETADMIAGARARRQDSPLRRGMSRLANLVRRALLRDGVTDTGCSLKLFRREVAESFLPIRTMYSFLPAFAVAAGWTVREVPVAHRPRVAGVSKYGLRAMAILPLLDLLALCWILRRTVPRASAARARP
jgi:dolichol-phosphate mannosyltransferase